MNYDNLFDTSTTAGKIAVMQASEFQLAIDRKYRDSVLADWERVSPRNIGGWEWDMFDFRIAPGQDEKVREFVRRFYPEEQRVPIMLRKQESKRRVPCGPEDFPPGTVVTGICWAKHEWGAVLSVTEKHIMVQVGLNCEPTKFHFEDLMPGAKSDHIRRSIDNGKNWLPCYKEE